MEVAVELCTDSVHDKLLENVSCRVNRHGSGERCAGAGPSLSTGSSFRRSTKQIRLQLEVSSKDRAGRISYCRQPEQLLVGILILLTENTLVIQYPNDYITKYITG